MLGINSFMIYDIDAKQHRQHIIIVVNAIFFHVSQQSVPINTVVNDSRECFVLFSFCFGSLARIPSH